MALDARSLQFAVAPPSVQRYGDGSFGFTVVIINPSQIAGGIPEVVGRAEVYVTTDIVCLSLAEALRQISGQLPGKVLDSAGN